MIPTIFLERRLSGKLRFWYHESEADLRKRIGALVLPLTLLPAPAAAQVGRIRVSNPCGGVTAKAVVNREIRVSHSSPTRASHKDDVAMSREQGALAVECRASDGARIDISVAIPYGVELEAVTTSGPISVEGLVSTALLKTSTGEIHLTAPWPATRLLIEAASAPGEFVKPDSVKFSERRHPPGWIVRDRLSESKITAGDLRVEAQSPARVVLADMEIPEDSPVKLPWQAPEILEEILSGSKPRQTRESLAAADRRGEAEDAAVFRSEVRMVNLLVSVYDAEGNPFAGLRPEDFEVLEDGVPQDVAFAGSEEVPFNLAFLLDLSGSTLRDRPAMKEAVRRFVGITQAHDRVAAYALANNQFHVISPLTANRAELLAAIEALPAVSGGTPLFDAVVLSYAEEFRHRANERNALIVVSDGVDNQIQGIVTPSKVSYRKLKRAAAEIHALIYPVFLNPFDKVPPPRERIRARDAMAGLAEASGGRLFEAHSLNDLEPVYPLVAAELRSVYTVAYYPKNQEFDGRWRSIQVRVKQLGAKLRTRSGYAAR